MDLIAPVHPTYPVESERFSNSLPDWRRTRWTTHRCSANMAGRQKAGVQCFVYPPVRRTLHVRTENVPLIWIPFPARPCKTLPGHRDRTHLPSQGWSHRHTHRYRWAIVWWIGRPDRDQWNIVITRRVLRIHVQYVQWTVDV